MTLEAPLWLPGVADANGVLQPQYSARDDRQLIADIFTEGVMNQIGGDLKVAQRALGANFSVDVAAGRAFITGDDQTDQGRYRVQSTATENLGVEPAPGAGLHRVDRVVAEVLDAGVNSTLPNVWRLRVITGAAVATTNTPAAPGLPNTAISLATIGPIASTTTSITDALITDTRRSSGVAMLPAHDPGAAAGAPSTYPQGVSVGTVALADGWPVSGNLVTYRRAGTRIWQELVQADSALGRARRYFRHGYYSAAEAIDGWAPWQRTVEDNAVSTALIDVEESTTSLTYAHLTTAGPSLSSVQIGPSGKALVIVSCRLRNSLAGALSYASFEVTGGVNYGIFNRDAVMYESSNAGDFMRGTAVTLVTGLAQGGNTFTMRYAVDSGTGSFGHRRITVVAL